MTKPKAHHVHFVYGVAKSFDFPVSFNCAHAVTLLEITLPNA